MKRIVLLAGWVTSLFPCNEIHNPPRIIYRTTRHIKIITPEGDNRVYVEANAVVIPELNRMNITLQMYINDILIGEQNNEVNW